MVDLLIDSGDIAPSQPIDVNWQGPNLKATYAGKVLRIARNMPVSGWQSVSTTHYGRSFENRRTGFASVKSGTGDDPTPRSGASGTGFSKPVGHISPPLMPPPHRNRIMSISMTARTDRSCAPVMTIPDPIPWRMYPMLVKPKSR